MSYLFYIVQLLILSFALLAPWAIKITQWSGDGDTVVGVQPLHVAAFQKPRGTGATKCDKDEHYRCMKALLDQAPELDLRSRRGTTPLYVAASGGNRVVVEMLLEARAGTQS